MSSVPSSEVPQRLTLTHWLILVIAVIGFAFDTYSLLMLPLVARYALGDLGARPGTPEFREWVGLLFYVPAVAGGIFGLLGGYLTDRFGRRRVLTWSILLYAVSAFFSGFATSLPMLLVLRCTTFVGVCVEFVAGVAWLAELFPEPRQRERVLGYTQAFSSIGGLLVAGVNHLIAQHALSLPALTIPAQLGSWIGNISDPHSVWRYTLMSGLIPALPLIVIRPFLPESPIWAAKRAAGTLKRPRFMELFAPALRRTTIVSTLMMACSFGAAFGAIQQIQQIIPGLPDVQARTAEAPTIPQKKQIEQGVSSLVTEVQEIGGLVGRFVLAALAVVVVSRRGLMRMFQLPGLILVPLVFIYPAVHSLNLLYIGMFIAGFLTVAQFSFWGNYLPRVYPVHLRGTGESFAANIGGRMIGTIFAAVTSALAGQAFIPGHTTEAKWAYTAAGVAFFVYAAGSILCFFLPEPKSETLLD